MNFTGVPATSSDPTGHSTKMRGLGNAKVLVLLDGVPLMDPFYLTTQWFKVPVSNIERVEVVRGGNSSLWGNMAVAGVVNIVSKRAKNNAGEARVSAGSYGTTNVAVSKNFAASDTLNFTLTADQFQSSGYQTTPDEYLWRFPGKQPAEAKNTNFQATTYFKPSADLNGFLRLGYHIQDQDLGYVYNDNLQKSPDMAAGLSKKISESSSISANIWAQYVNFEKYNGASCYWQALAATKCPTSSNVTAAQINNSIVQYYTQYGSQRYREHGGSAVYSRNVRGKLNNFQIGVDYRNLSAKDTEFIYVAPTVLTTPQKLNSSTYGQGTQTFKGIFGQAKVYPLESLELTFSGRYDSWVNNDKIYQRTPVVGPTAGGALPETSKTRFNPSMAARYDLNGQVSLRGATYKAFRAPGFNNMLRQYGTNTSTTLPNPDLTAEEMTGWEWGADYNSERFFLGATYFLYKTTNMIATYTVNATAATIPAPVLTICGPVFAGRFSTCDNAGSVKYYTQDQDGESHGIELTGNWKILDNLKLDGSYTHTETYLTRNGPGVTDPLGIQLVEVPKNTALVGVTWKATEKLNVYTELRHIGSMLTDTTTAGGPYKQGSNTVYNASATYAWSKAVDMSVSAINVFDHQYAERSYKPDQPYNRTLSMPRSITMGLRARF
jgi:iron complex outermembrane receptor protein